MYEFFGQPHSESLKAMYVPFPYQKYMRHTMVKDFCGFSLLLYENFLKEHSCFHVHLFSKHSISIKTFCSAHLFKYIVN